MTDSAVEETFILKVTPVVNGWEQKPLVVFPTKRVLGCILAAAEVGLDDADEEATGLDEETLRKAWELVQAMRDALVRP
jgi:hypothetical protein